MPEAADVAEGAQERGAGGWGRDVVDRCLFKSPDHGGDCELAARVPFPEVLGSVDRRARPVHHPVRVERVDLQRLRHPAQLRRLLGRGGVRAPGQPWHGGHVRGVPVLAGGVRGVVPRLRPCAAAVRGAEDQCVGPPGAVAGHHDRARVLPVERQAAVAVEGVRLGRRADVLPLAGLRRVPPHLALAAVVRAAGVAVRHVQVAVLGVEDALVREVAGGLAGQPLPGRARVRRPVDGVLLVGDPDVERLRTVGPGARRLVERHPRHALVVGRVARGVGRVRRVVAGVREGRDLRPRRARVRRAPQALAAGRAQVEHLVVVRVDREALTHAAARHVAAEFEGEVGLLPRRATVRGAQDRAVPGVPVVRVSADGRVHLVRVDGVGGERGHARVAPVVPADRIEQRRPGLGALLPAVGAADVGAGVGEVLLAAVEDDAGDEATAVDTGVLPGVGVRGDSRPVGRIRLRGLRVCQQACGQGDYGRREQPGAWSSHSGIPGVGRRKQGCGPGDPRGGGPPGPVVTRSRFQRGRYSSSSAYEPMASAMSAWAQNRWYVNVGAAPPAK